MTVYRSNAQLVGSRGVIALPEGFVYHDNETLDASKKVAEYAKKYQVVEDHQVAQNLLISLQKGDQNKQKIPKYESSSNNVGREIPLNDILSFENTRYFNTPVENRQNVPLEAIEKERANGKIRLLPGEGVIPAQRYAPKTTNRFEAVNTEQSERAKNKGETIFDDGPNETKLKYQYKGRPILKEYYDKYFGKAKHAPLNIESPRSRQSTPKIFTAQPATASFHPQPTTSLQQNNQRASVSLQKPQAVPVSPEYQHVFPSSPEYPQLVRAPQEYQHSVPATQGYPQPVRIQQEYPQAMPVPHGYPHAVPVPQGYAEAQLFGGGVPHDYSFLVNHG